MLSWIVGMLLIVVGVAFMPLAYIAMAGGDETGNGNPAPVLLGLVPIALGVAIIYWR